MRSRDLFFALLVVATAASGAGIYKWVDEKGVTHFSELPPPGQPAQKPQKARAVGDETDPAAAAESTQPAGKSWQQKETEFRQRQIDRDAAARREQEPEAATKRLQRDCMQLRRRLEALQTWKGVEKVDEQGKRVVLSEKERTDMIQAHKQLIDQKCAGR